MRWSHNSLGRLRDRVSYYLLERMCACIHRHAVELAPNTPSHLHFEVLCVCPDSSHREQSGLGGMSDHFVCALTASS